MKFHVVFYEKENGPHRAEIENAKKYRNDNLSRKENE
jgi:hypothetical protein